MFEINTYFERFSYDYTDQSIMDNPEVKYVSLQDDKFLVQEIFNHRHFTPEHISILITIKYMGETVLGFSSPCGLDLWDVYMAAIKSYISKGRAEELYGIDPILLKLQPAGDEQVEFLIMDEFFEEDVNSGVSVFARTEFPNKAFFLALLDGAEHYWKLLIRHRIFELKELKATTSRKHPQIMIHQIHRLKEIVKETL